MTDQERDALTSAYTALRLYEQANTAGAAARMERQEAARLLATATARLTSLATAAA